MAHKTRVAARDLTNIHATVGAWTRFCVFHTTCSSEGTRCTCNTSALNSKMKIAHLIRAQHGPPPSFSLTTSSSTTQKKTNETTTLPSLRRIQLKRWSQHTCSAYFIALSCLLSHTLESSAQIGSCAGVAQCSTNQSAITACEIQCSPHRRSWKECFTSRSRESSECLQQLQMLLNRLEQYRQGCVWCTFQSCCIQILCWGFEDGWNSRSTWP